MSNVKLVTDPILEKLEKKELTPQQAVEEAAKSMATARVYRPPTTAEIKGRYVTNQTLIERALSSNIPFITEDTEIRLSQGLILIGGVSGKGKSTTNANILAGFVNANPSKQVMVITNEESTADVLDRVACVLLKYNFKSYRARQLGTIKTNEVQDLAMELAGQIIVEDGAGVYEMTCSDDVKAALAYIAESDVAMGTLDYFQTCNWSRSEPDLNPVQVSKDLGFWLKDFGRKVPKPIIMFVQLRESSDDSEFKERVENDRSVFNHAFMAIEVVPDFETGISKFNIVKDRFGGAQGRTLEMKYDGGRFVYEGGL